MSVFVSRPFLAGFLLLAATPAISGPITIDGKTATSVSSGTGGQLVVTVAPKNANSQSHNTFDTFNVPKQGVVFDNKSSGAKLILNEVTGRQETSIAGEVSIEGPAADLVIANPNGISVNGGAFLHTGRTLLTTGQRVGQTAAGLPTYSIGQGQISVTSNGLISKGQGLHLYASDVVVEGKVDASAGALHVNAGRGMLTAGQGGLSDWIDFSQAGEDGSLVVSAGAALSGGSIRLMSIGGNSGVRMAGSGFASSGNFQIDASGRITLSGSVKAKKTLFVNASKGGIEVAGSSSTIAHLESETEAVQLISEAGISGEHFKITGAGRGFFGFATNAAVSLRASQDINMADGELLSKSSDVEVVTEKAAKLTRLSLQSAKDINASSEAALSFATVTGSADERISIESAAAELSVANTTLTGKLGIRLKAKDIALQSATSLRTIIRSTEGGVSLETTGAVRNYGALIEGVRKSEGDDKSEGAVTVHAGTLLRNETVSETSIGSFYATEGPLIVKAGKVENISGRLLSEKDLTISTTGEIVNGVLQVGEIHAGLSDTKDAANFGAFAIGKEIGQITATEALIIKAGSKLSNVGGDISGKAVNLSADQIYNSPERFGSQSFKTRCIIFFCRTTGSSDVSHDGGTISASGSLKLTAQSSIVNEGGTLNGGSALQLDAPKISLTSLQFWQSFTRPSGLGGFFRGSSSIQVMSFQEGSLSSTAGDIILNSGNKVLQRATSLSAKGAVRSDNGVQKEDIDQYIRLKNKREIGFFRYFVGKHAR